jgi:hypothetical protein
VATKKTTVVKEKSDSLSQSLTPKEEDEHHTASAKQALPQNLLSNNEILALQVIILTKMFCFTFIIVGSHRFSDKFS